MIIHDVKQQTDEWYKLRHQYPLTASNAQAIGNNGKGLETLVWSVLADRYSFAEKENYTNQHLERGVELETQARAIYELETGNELRQVGFIINENITKVGGFSPDGLIGEDGLLEIKCFDDKKHFKYLINGLEVESQYEWQVQMQLLISDRKWCDFMAYNPNYRSTSLVVQITPDKEKQDKIKEGLVTGEKLIRDIEAKIAS